MNLRRRARSDERGAVAVEFALIALPLILLLFLIVESAFLMKDYVVRQQRRPQRRTHRVGLGRRWAGHVRRERQSAAVHAGERPCLRPGGRRRDPDDRDAR